MAHSIRGRLGVGADAVAGGAVGGVGGDQHARSRMNARPRRRRVAAIIVTVVLLAMAALLVAGYRLGPDRRWTAPVHGGGGTRWWGTILDMTPDRVDLKAVNYSDEKWTIVSAFC